MRSKGVHDRQGPAGTQKGAKGATEATQQKQTNATTHKANATTRTKQTTTTQATQTNAKPQIEARIGMRFLGEQKFGSLGLLSLVT